ncbi:RelA/SpoT domain-containing protein [Dermabacteraceae bacterium CCM 9520]
MGNISKSAVKKAGSNIRRRHRGENISLERYVESEKIIRQYRAEHQVPLYTIRAGLRREVQKADIKARITQRLKRLPTILDKLIRGAPSGVDDLSRMGDIGGCRVIVASRDDLYRLKRILEEKWSEQSDSLNSIKRVRDYIYEPRESGYRAVHLQVERGGLQFEVQLRDGKLHEWAELVERWSRGQGVNYKQDGSSPFQRMMAQLSVVQQQEEVGQEPSQEQLDKLATLYLEVDLGSKHGELPQ